MPKLVRDFIPSIMESRNEKGVFHVADDKEYRIRLNDKLLEEAEEFCESESIEELADLLEVIHAIAAFHGLAFNAIEEARLKKFKERGGFSRRLIKTN